MEPLNKQSMRVDVFREGGIRVLGSGKMWGFGVPVDEEIFTGTREDRIDKATEMILNIGRFGAVTVRPAFIGPRVTRLPQSHGDIEALPHRYRHRIAKVWPSW